MSRSIAGVAFTIAGLSTGCSESRDLLTSAAPPLQAEVAQQVFVFNTQLRAVTDEEYAPSSAYGHIQLKLTASAESPHYEVQWSGKIFNPASEEFIGGLVGIINPDLVPPPSEEDPPILPGQVFRLFDLREVGGLTCNVIEFDSEGLEEEVYIAWEIGWFMLANPDLVEARFVSSDRRDGAIAGLFGATADPMTLLGFNPQPDPPKGQQARCAV